MTKYTEFIKHHEGDGQLIKGDSPPLQVSYVMDIYREIHEPHPGAPRVQGLEVRTGSVSGPDQLQLWDLYNQDLTLVLEDESRWIIRIDTDGTIINMRPA